MKKYISLFIILICLSSTAFYEALAVNQGEGKGKGDQTKFLPKTAADPVSSVININNITTWITADGFMPNLVGGSWNGSFPKGVTAGVIYQEGIVWGGQVDDGNAPVIRVGGNTYNNGTTRLTRLVRVRPDYATADLTDDAANFYLVANSDVTSSQIDEIRAQYAKDWNEWPANLGAPFEDKNNNGIYEPNIDVPGIPGASQTIFVSYDDRNASDTYNSPPIGLRTTEVLWAYAIANPLGNVIFKKVTMIYDGTTTSKPDSKIDSMYIVQWSDPDLGQYTDDFAGSDSTLGMMYVYNSTTLDNVFAPLGIVPPAGGYDFLGGVWQYTGNPDDSAIVNLQWKKGYKFANVNASGNPLSTAVYFAGGGAWNDPTFDYTGTLEWYNLMRGYRPEAVQQVFPSNVTNKPQGGDGTFLLSGDPVAGTGQLDGVAEPAGDRRICAVTGPFTLALHDTAEIVSSLIAGIGSNNLTSVSVLKFYDKFAQYAYDNLFVLPVYPPPKVSVTNLDGKVLLNWANQQNIDDIETPDHGGYPFEGYNVYQLKTADVSSAVKIATFDVVNNVTTILDDQVDPTTAAIIQRPAQVGKNTGIQRTMTIDNDATRGNVPLVNGTQYYFAVSAYGYNGSGTVPFHALESSLVPLSAVPQTTNPGVRYAGKVGDTLTVTHTGPNDGGVIPIVVDPSVTTGHNYKVNFTGSPAVWSLTDVTANKVVLDNQSNQSGDDNYLVVDGIMTKVTGPPLDFAYFITTANASGPLDPPEAFAADYNGFPLGPATGGTGAGDQQVSGAYWLFASTRNTHNAYADVLADVTQYSGGLGEANQGISALIPDDFEIRFTATGSDGDWGFGTTHNGEIVHVPFEVWDIGNPSDPNDDFQVYCQFLDNNDNGVFDLGATDHAMSGASNDPFTDGIYMVIPKDRTPGSSGYQGLLTFATNNAPFSDYAAWAYNYGPPEYPSDPFASYPGIIRMVMVSWNGGTVPGPYAVALPEEGTIFRIGTTKPNTADDEFTFTAPAVTQSNSLAKVDIEKMNVFPNPYYGFNSREQTRAGKYVTFSHLPQQAKIRIYDLAGNQVRVINKNDTGQFVNWNLLNEYGYPVASGVYVVYVDMPGIGATKILKLAVVQEQQVLNVY